MNTSVTSLILSVGCIIGCGTEKPVEHFRPFAELQKTALEKYALVRTEVQTFLETIPECPTDDGERQGWCKLVRVEFGSSKAASLSSQGQRFLVLDKGMRLAAFTRYRARVLDDIEPDESGVYRSVNKSVVLPLGMHHVLSEILNSKYPNTPALALQGIRHSVLRAPDYILQHGERIFATLADLNPDAEFVIAQITELPTHLLRSDQDEREVIDTISSYLDKNSASLIDIITKYDINFANMSFGDTVETIQDTLSPFINPEIQTRTFFRRVLKLIKERFYERLFSLQNVLFVQAGPSSSYPLRIGDPDFDIDCTRYPNRLRAGYVQRLRTDVPQGGSPRPDYVREIASRHCIDVFLNSGVVYIDLENRDIGEYPYLSTRTGIGVQHAYDHFTSSWAAPFVLSYLNFRRQSTATNKTIDIHTHLIDSHFILEPFKYGQFEIFRTGRL